MAPYDYLPPAPRRRELAPSAAIEISWLITSCSGPSSLLDVPTQLATRAETFWGDGKGLMIEMLVVAQQVGCLSGWNVDPLFDLARTAIRVPNDLRLETEPDDERLLTLARVERLAADAALRKRYSKLLRDLWTLAEPAWTALGRPTVERSITRLQASLDHGVSALDLIPEGHIAHKPHFREMVQAAVRDNTLIVTPSYFAGTHGHIVALPGALSVALGAGVTEGMARRRTDAERVAGELKLLSDPTRVLILGELEREPMTVGDTARCVGIAQPTASVHLRQLREAGLIEARREDARTVYVVQRGRLRDVIDGARATLLESLGAQ
jgi:ArsR family transcriptional regulator, arsenate/arsenite/antimonite-responsive transcriptional repressor